MVALMTLPAAAEGPAFDRPGIAFAPSTLPAHGFAWEQGLPDYQRDAVDGVTEKAYAASTRLRYGVTDRWEVQLAVPLFQTIDSSGMGQAFSTAGTGDLSVAIKFDLAPGDAPFNAALLGTVSFPTAAQQELGLQSEQYSLGATAGWQVGDDQSLALYASVDVLDGSATWTLSPNWSFTLTDTLAGYVEAGFQPASHGNPVNDVAGAGVAWMVRPTVQLDAYFLAGLTEDSTDLAWGVGVSMFVP